MGLRHLDLGRLRCYPELARHLLTHAQPGRGIDFRRVR